jgi:hypothetical protein
VSVEKERLDRQLVEQGRDKALADRLEARNGCGRSYGRSVDSEGSWNARNRHAAIPFAAMPFHQFL